jgi:hypothetical protein
MKESKADLISLSVQKAIHIKGIVFEGAVRLVKEQIAAFFEVDVRTIERYL